MNKRFAESPILRSVTIVGLLGMSASAVSAQVVEIDEIRAIEPNASVEFEVIRHSLVIEAWDRSEIQVVGAYDQTTEELEIDASGQSFSFEIDFPQARNRADPAGADELIVRVPAGVQLEAETVSGSIRVSGLTGEVSAESVSGDVAMDGLPSVVSLSSVSGSVEFTGDAQVAELEAVSGAVRFSGRAQDVELQSVSGSVEARADAETLEASSVSGSLTVAVTNPVRMLEMESVSGGIQFTGQPAPGGVIEANSFSGSVELILGEQTAARFDLETFSGSITSEFPGASDEVRRTGRFAPGESLSFVTGSGDGRVDASTHSGSIRVRAP